LKAALPEQGRSFISAAEAAQTAENLPDGAAVGTTAIVAVKEEHLADLLLWISSREDRGIVTYL